MTHRDNIAAWLGEPGTPTRDACDRLLGQVADMRADNVVYPEQDAILRALELCGPTDTRVVILGQDPYHEPGQAGGLCFSVADGVPFPPSLQTIFKEVADDTGAPIPTSGSLRRWAGQGVLLLNATLRPRPCRRLTCRPRLGAVYRRRGEPPGQRPRPSRVHPLGQPCPAQGRPGRSAAPSRPRLAPSLAPLRLPRILRQPPLLARQRLSHRPRAAARRVVSGVSVARRWLFY